MNTDHNSPEILLPQIHRYHKNELGIDYFVGDIHGCFTELEKALAEVKFDPTKDRLFSVGDLIDRGKESKRSLEFLAKPWFHAVRGNHEQLAVEYIDKKYSDLSLVHTGGNWLNDLSKEERDLFKTAFLSLPIVIEIDSAYGKIGVIHAAYTSDDWDNLIREFTGEEAQRYSNWVFQTEEIMLWDRHLMRTDGIYISNVYALVHGHTPVAIPLRNENKYYIDMGAVYTGKNPLLVTIHDLNIDSEIFTDMTELKKLSSEEKPKIKLKKK